MHALKRDILAILVGGLTAGDAVSNVAEGLLAPIPFLRETSSQNAEQSRSVLNGAALAARLGLSESAPKPPPLDAVLLGTMVANEDGLSMALIDVGKPLTVHVGDAVGAYEVAEIDLRHVWLTSNGTRVELGKGKSAATVPLPKFDELARGVLVIPTTTGFRFTRLAPDAPLATYGLQQGDEVRAINGVPLTSIEAVTGLAATLATVRHFDVDLWRNGALIRRSIDLSRPTPSTPQPLNRRHDSPSVDPRPL